MPLRFNSSSCLYHLLLSKLGALYESFWGGFNNAADASLHEDDDSVGRNKYGGIRGRIILMWVSSIFLILWPPYTIHNVCLSC